MFSIDKTDYGYKLTFSGKLERLEMAQWLEDSESVLADHRGTFTVFVDMRNMEPASPMAQKFILRGQNLYSKKGMVRSVVILNNAALSMQVKRIATQSGIYEGERYIDSAHNPQWEEAGLGWLTECIEPNPRRKKTLAARR